MNIQMMVNQIVEKTRLKRLLWEGTAIPEQVIAPFGGEFVIRMIGPRSLPGGITTSPCLVLETVGGQTVFSIGSDEASAVCYEFELSQLWEMVCCGGKSVEEVAEDALRSLTDL